MNPLTALTRHGVHWGIWRTGALRIATADMHGAPTERRVQGMIQRAHTADRLFSSVIVVQQRRLVFAQMSSALTADSRAAERNALLTDVGLSLLLPEWADRGGWLAGGLRMQSLYREIVALQADDDEPQHGVSAVAWPAPHVRARLTVSPAPAAFVHCTVTWRD